MRNGTMKKTDGIEKSAKKIKSQVQKHLSHGKSSLMWLERQIRNPKAKLKAEFEKNKEKVIKLGKKFREYEEKAVQYTEKNPKKALAIASAAGVLVGRLLVTFRRKGPMSLAHR